MSATLALPSVIEPQNGCAMITGTDSYCASNSAYLAIRVSPVLYLVSIIDLLGFLLLVVFGGIGFSALPFDLILDWKDRPKRIDRREYESQRSEVGRRSDQLLGIGQLIIENRRRGATGRKERERYNRWRQAVILLDEDWASLKASYDINGFRVILSWAKLLGGVFSVILTLAWMLHILLYLIVPGNRILFLNGMLIALNNAWGMLGTIAYAIFAFYLLLCTVKGVVKFGMRFFFLLPVYPMNPNDTFMNAFMFNTILILISSLAATHFCTNAFADFANSTAVSQIFVLTIGSLRVLKYWYTYSVFALIGVPIIAIIYLGIKPHDKVAKQKDSS